MTFYKNLDQAKNAPFVSSGDHCFCCNEKIEGSVVAYDAYPNPDSERLVRVMMHRDCAFAMAQRLICDAWPNRHEGELLKVDA
ncbi:hypothetical protein [Chromobacterium haemolyticum]|uniref:hypothetical protein n=1 Tax=Chromobacterium TaxID=535 RepID=UPI0040573053